MANKFTKDYINKKIEMIDGLIQNAISLAQAAAYEVYRKFWIDKLSPSQNPDVIAEKEALKEAKAAELAEKKRIAAEAKALKNAEVEAAKAEEARLNAEKETKLADTLKQIEELKKLLPQKTLIEEPEEVTESAPEKPIND